MNFIKGLIVDSAISSIKKQVKIYSKEHLNQEEYKLLSDLSINLYSMPIPEFLEWAVETLSNKNLDNITFPDYIKTLIDSMNNEAEDVIKQVLNGLNPNE